MNICIFYIFFYQITTSLSSNKTFKNLSETLSSLGSSNNLVHLDQNHFIDNSFEVKTNLTIEGQKNILVFYDYEVNYFFQIKENSSFLLENINFYFSFSYFTFAVIFNLEENANLTLIVIFFMF